MPKMRPITYHRYRRAVLRRIFPEAFESRTTDIASSEKVKITEKTVTNYVSLPKRGEHPKALVPRNGEFGLKELEVSLTTLAKFYTLDDEVAGKVRFITNGKHAPLLLNGMLSVAYEEGFQVIIKDPVTKKSLNANVSSANNFFEQKKKILVEFVDLRSPHRFEVQLENWQETFEGHLSSPENNSFVSRIWRSTADANLGRVGSILELLPSKTDDVVDFDIDWVFSWVNGEDPDWKRMFQEWAPNVESDAVDRSRFETRDDLKYALRSLEQFAPWVRKIFVLTNCKPPAWLTLDSPRIEWIYHEEVFDLENLPTFSSHAIETVLHKIPGLSEHFVYSNDDFFLVRRTTKSDFFWPNGIARLRLENYGMVNGPVRDGEPDYLNAARNSAALLHKKFNRSAVRLHTHSPQSMNRVVLEELEGLFTEDFQRTRGNRFRHMSDIAVSGFLYHHYAYMTGKAVPDGSPTRLIQQNHRFEVLFANLLKERSEGRISKFLSVCVNDGRGSADNSLWGKSALNFVNGFFPNKSQFEK